MPAIVRPPSPGADGIGGLVAEIRLAQPVIDVAASPSARVSRAGR